MTIKNLLETARQETGLRDFGNEGFIEPMTRFLALNSFLTDQGRSERLDMVLRWLVNRLRMQHDFNLHPEISVEDVSDPVVILGLPRSGSTALQRMLSADPGMQTLYTWQALNPARFPGEIIGRPEARIAFAKQIENDARTRNPESFAAHAVLAEDAEEDTLLHWSTCQSIHQFSLAPSVGEYVRHLRNCSQLPSYRYVADIYRYLQWQGGGKRGRRWVMKSPNHLGCLEEIVAVHPNAAFILLIRDYRAAFASMCRLLEVHYQYTYRDIQPSVLGSVLLEFWAGEVENHKAARARLANRLRLMELDYRDLMADPMSSIQAIHDFSGSELTAEGRAAIKGWMEKNPQGKHGKFEYDLARYGISTEAVDAVFGKAAAE